MKIRKLFKDEYEEREWFMFAKAVLFVLVVSAVAFLLTAAIARMFPEPYGGKYEGKGCYCECQEEEK